MMMNSSAFAEPVFIPDTYATGLGDIEDLGEGLYRFTFFSKQRAAYGAPGESEPVVVARIILPSAAIAVAVRETMQATGLACCGAKRTRQLVN